MHNHVASTKHVANMYSLEKHVVFPVSWIFGAEGKDVTS
jgi:hypothetical protein